jgi:hypothetical protein
VGGAEKVGDASAGDPRHSDSRANFAERGGPHDRGGSPASGCGTHTIEEAELGHRMVQRGDEVQSFNRQLECGRSPTRRKLAHPRGDHDRRSVRTQSTKSAGRCQICRRAVLGGLIGAAESTVSLSRRYRRRLTAAGHTSFDVRA